MRGKDYNTMFVDLQMAGISCYQNFLRAVIDSNYAKEFNPYTDYLYALPLGRDGLHRPAGRHPDDREPGAMAEGLQTVDSGSGGLRTERRGHEPARHHPLQRAGKGKEQLDSAPAAARVERVLLQRHNRPEQQGRCPPARHANHHQHGGVRRREARRAGSIEANHRAGQRDAAQGLRHRSLHPAPPLLLHREHQQPAVPAGHRRKPAFPPHHRHRHRLPHPVNHPGIYAQALALLKDGFRYWYEGEEIEQLNKHNERHRMKDPVEENLFVFFRKPLPEDLQVKWLPASVILTKLSIFGKVQVNPHTQLVLVQALEKYGFGTRTNEQETTEYEVVDIQLYQ